MRNSMTHLRRSVKVREMEKKHLDIAL